MSRPPSKKELFRQSKLGYYGELGEGAGAQIMYLQTAIEKDELDKISLITDIPGSEKWDIRDLFQREVDNTRVTKSILPYLKDPNKIKFFNPLTLVLLPLDESYNVIKENPFVSQNSLEEDNWEYTEYRYEDFYRYLRCSQPSYSRLEWNDRKVKLVAIDGQHRLSALKRLASDPEFSSEVNNWTIPVVILSPRKNDKKSKSNSILELVRNLFIYINSTSQDINDSRRVLLDDENVSTVCTQEIIQNSHSNDIKDKGVRDNQVLPLTFFDWRGEESSGDKVVNPAALKTTVEVKKIVEEYLLSPDNEFSDVYKNLLLDDLEGDEVILNQKKKTLTSEESKIIRKQFKITLMPGILTVFQSFSPYFEYINSCRTLENEVNTFDNDKQDLVRHAYMRIRFGNSSEDISIKDEVDDEYKKLLKRYMDFHEAIPELLLRDIGLRGVFSAFAKLKPIYDEANKSFVQWDEYALRFISNLNLVYDDSWFHEKSKTVRETLRHVVRDEREQICNYRFDQVDDSFGVLLSILILSKDLEIKRVIKEDYFGICSSNLQNTIFKGWKKELRPKYREEYPNGGLELTKAIEKEAERKAKKQMNKIEKMLLK
jgi:hypothetical protein